jgi:hypothetical protein
MVTPRMRQGPPEGQPWAADNGRYASPEEYTDAGYLAWLERWRPAAGRCLFATAPDVVGDAEATLELSLPMLRPIRAAGYPVALVAQDGLEALPVPWEQIDALFIGGTTAWKLGEAAHELATQALARGLHVHMGRVNSLRRLRLARAMGCHSVDGTFLRWAPTENRARMAEWWRQLESQPEVWHGPAAD